MPNNPIAADAAAFILKAKELIESGERHADYGRTVELAETYRILITGKEIEKKLIQYVTREEPEMFAQRVRLTKSITPALASMIRKPFNKVIRNGNVRKGVEMTDERRKIIIEKMIAGFYGTAGKENRGLDYWMKVKAQSLQFSDPNAWVVIEWDPVPNQTTPFKPRPFEVRSAEAINFFVANDEIQWLFVSQDITKKAAAPKVEPSGVIVPAAAPGLVNVPAKRFTLYAPGYTVVHEEIDRDFYLSLQADKRPAGDPVEIKKSWYLVNAFKTGLNYAPVLRIGYVFDEETQNRTFVNPWHDALCYFEKTLKTVSELDLTMTLHTFPQKLQYVQQCKGVAPAQGQGRMVKHCNMGLLQDGSTCPTCAGKGYKVHTTAQDIILLPLPTDAKREDIIDLEKLIAYKAPPIDLIKTQREYIAELKADALDAVFNSPTYTRKNANGKAPAQTATENDNDMQSVYDALEPFTEKYSEIWKDVVTTFGLLAGDSLEAIKPNHDFPADFKLKTAGALMAEREAATKAGVPGFYLQQIDTDLAAIAFAGDQKALKKYATKEWYLPFSGSSADDIANALLSEFVPKYSKVLYLNFDLIFKELEAERLDFYEMANDADQKALVDKKVAEIIQRLQDERPAPLTIDTMRQANPLNNPPAGS